MSKEAVKDSELPRAIERPTFHRGQRFGKYTLLARLAVGGMAEIFLARQTGLEGFDKLIIIKRMRSHFTQQPKFVQMFLNEAKLASNLTHPHIVQIYDLGRISESFFIAMEYVQGQDMSRITAKAAKVGIPFPMEYALKVCSNVLEGLYYAHNKEDAAGEPLNIVHRDISPENVIVGWNGTVKILDFGIAKARHQVSDTRTGEIKGKLTYMSPEQCMGKEVDHRSDLFSLGVMLYEWVTGLKLFTGENELQIMNNIVDGKIYPPSYFREHIPPRVEAIVMKALAKDRRKRYGSAWDMQFDVDTFLSSHEFTPSNIHLGNFIKQIFEKEIEDEQAFLKRILAETAHIAHAPEQQQGEVIELDPDGPDVYVSEPSGPRPPTPDARAVTVYLNGHERELLDTLARRKRISVEEILLDWMRAHLRYLDDEKKEPR